MPDPIQDRAKRLRQDDAAPKTKADWDARRDALRPRLLAAMGPMPEMPCDLEPRVIGKLDREGYRIEKLVFQSRPGVWVTATAYVPGAKGKVPAVLAVHGHWALARRDPVVQARCLGLVKLGFFVLAVDAFGSGERHTTPAKGTYHGALYGSTLWPTGHTLLGMQVYDNRRAIDYLVSRPEVNGKVGITGASGGGNQSMYAGALDDRIAAVVPVCSVGNYQAYLKAACCVCEVLPDALTFTEEGDVLGLVAPRALLVISAAKDALQFSPAEAESSIARASAIYKRMDSEATLKHVIIDSGHDYNQAMREAMYGWMTLHLKGEGEGKPIAEPKHTVDAVEDLACFPNLSDRPKGFLTPPLFAGVVGRELVRKLDRLTPDHREMWEATADQWRAALAKLIGELPTDAKLEDTGEAKDGIQPFRLHVEPGVTLSGTRTILGEEVDPDRPPVLLLTAGEDWLSVTQLPGIGVVHRLSLRGLPLAKSAAIAGAPDHTPAEHGVWTGRTSLAGWTADTVAMLRSIPKPVILVGVGPMAIVAAAAAALSPREVRSLVLVDSLTTYVTDAPYGAGTFMGILAPGILKAVDVPHLMSLVAPKRLVVSGGVSPQGEKLAGLALTEAFKFTERVYQACKADDALTIARDVDWTKLDL